MLLIVSNVSKSAESSVFATSIGAKGTDVGYNAVGDLNMIACPQLSAFRHNKGTVEMIPLLGGVEGDINGIELTKKTFFVSKDQADITSI